MKGLSKTFGGAILVGGTALGAGMLALPLATGSGGFFPAILIFVICYLFSVATGLLYLEICLWMPQDSNIVSMASHLLGRVGKSFAWLLYLFLFYTLTVAYISGGGGFVVDLTEGAIPLWLGQVIFTALFGSFVYLGTRFVDRVNSILMLGLVISFIMFVSVALGHVKGSFLTRVNFPHAIMALPVMFTSFSYQGVIPSLNTYLDRDPKKVKLAIITGTAIPFLVYILWEVLILGVVPLSGSYGLIAAKANGWTAVQPLRYAIASKVTSLIGEFFAFFALTTSFLGVTLSLLDFLADGLQVKKTPLNKLFLCIGIYLPPLIISSTIPGIFIKALGYAGGIGTVLLLGLYPALMVWIGRYKKNYPSVSRQLFGGKVMLLVLFVFIVFELVVEFLNDFI